MNTRTTLTASTVLALVCASGLLVAGPLAPPSGSVLPTYKTLGEVEPRIAINSANTPGDSASLFKITQPGSYYLTGNIGVGAAKDGIRIESSNVTIDLNGFTLYGLPGSLAGITTGNTTHRVAITVRNGIVRTFGTDGISVRTFGVAATPQGALFENLQVSENGDRGLEADDGIVRGCSFNRNGSDGLGLLQSFPSSIENCTADSNANTGMYAASGVFRGCAASHNANTGIQIGEGTVTHCTAIGNSTGFTIDGAISECAATDNSTRGIVLVGAAINNTVRRAPGATGAGETGIEIVGSRSRVEDNTICGLPTAVLASTSNNIIIGNRFSANTTAINVPAGNRVGPIVIGAFSAAINGNAGGGLGATDPFANILY